MSIQTCPTAVIRAPVERVWHCLTSPAELERWSGARLILVPTRPLMAGDSLLFTAGMGGLMRVAFYVLGIDAERRLALMVYLPFGIVNRETVVITPVSPVECRVTFN